MQRPQTVTETETATATHKDIEAERRAASHRDEHPQRNRKGEGGADRDSSCNGLTRNRNRGPCR